jgi:GNAT superfamily N-acetyltransferase/ketosteroid isomerase-like protein
MSQENVDKTRGFIDAYNRRDFEAATRDFDRDIEWVLPEHQRADSAIGTPGIIRFWKGLDETFDELQLRPQEFVDAGDRVATRLRHFARGKGSGLELDNELYHQVVTFRDGVIVRIEYVTTWEEALELAGDRPSAGASGRMNIRRCRDDERGAILAIVNAAAEAYRDVIPADRWHEPYMPAEELDEEIAAGVEFWGYDDGGVLSGIMGIQTVRDVDLIRHAYVAPGRQGHGIGSALMEHLERSAERPLLVGTWAAAEWAIRFYRRHGFEPAGPERSAELLRRYWNIPARQIETSVVLTKPPD